MTQLLSYDFFSLIALPSSAQIIEGIPVIISLIIIEGLLSVDNALAIAAMARHLPGKQKYLALKYGIIGAYFFRGLCLFFAASIIENPWLKICGAAYLLYLMCEHFTGAGDEDNDGKPDSPNTRGLFATIVAIEIMDLSLSIDNVVAAIAFTKGDPSKMWMVYAGVFIGILALRFVAGACIKLIEKFPILEETAFLLIGFVGSILVYELLSDPHSGLHIIPGEAVDVSSTQKFIGIVIILALSILYSKIPALQSALNPLFKLAYGPMKLIAIVVGLILKILRLPFKLVIGLFKGKAEASPEVS